MNRRKLRPGDAGNLERHNQVLPEMRRRDGSEDSGERVEPWLAVLGLLEISAVPARIIFSVTWVSPDVPTVPAHVLRQREHVAADDFELALRRAEGVRSLDGHDELVAPVTAPVIWPVRESTFKPPGKLSTENV